MGGLTVSSTVARVTGLHVHDSILSREGLQKKSWSTAERQEKEVVFVQSPASSQGYQVLL